MHPAEFLNFLEEKLGTPEGYNSIVGSGRPLYVTLARLFPEGTKNGIRHHRDQLESMMESVDSPADVLVEVACARVALRKETAELPASRVLSQVIDLFQLPSQWVKESMAKDEWNDACSATAAHAVCWCAHGGLIRFTCSPKRVMSRDAAAHYVLKAAKQLGHGDFESVPRWNDHPDRTFVQVMEALNLAKTLAEEEE